MMREIGELDVGDNLGGGSGAPPSVGVGSSSSDAGDTNNGATGPDSND